MLSMTYFHFPVVLAGVQEVLAGVQEVLDVVREVQAGVQEVLAGVAGGPDRQLRLPECRPSSTQSDHRVTVATISACTVETSSPHS